MGPTLVIPSETCSYRKDTTHPPGKPESDAEAIDDSEFIKTLFPTAYKAMYKEPEKSDEGPENVDG